MRKSIPLLIAALIAAVFLFPVSVSASIQSSASAPASKAAGGKTEHSSQAIADAKSKGLVWVNTSTRVYHRDGPSYGTTIHGRFMSEENAKKAGYREAAEKGTTGKKP